MSAGDSSAEGQSTVSRHQDLLQALNSIQSGDLNSVLRQQPQLVQELSAIAAGDLCSNPESLKFQYDLQSSHTHAGGTSTQKSFVYREQDRFLPIHNVARIMRNSVPKNGKVSKDAKECMQECVSEFISFVTSEASDKCIQERRKTITGDDILFAMATLGFDNHIEPLRVYLQRYREFTKADKTGSPPPDSLSGSNVGHNQSDGPATPHVQFRNIAAMPGPFSKLTVTHAPALTSVGPSVDTAMASVGTSVQAMASVDTRTKQSELTHSS